MNWSHPLLNTVVGGLMGIAGALLGFLLSILSDNWREGRRERRQTVNAMLAVLHGAISAHLEWERSAKSMVGILEQAWSAPADLRRLALGFEGLLPDAALHGLARELQAYEEACQDQAENQQALALARGLARRLRQL